jgi:hypothetical protein
VNFPAAKPRHRLGHGEENQHSLNSPSVSKETLHTFGLTMERVLWSKDKIQALGCWCQVVINPKMKSVQAHYIPKKQAKEYIGISALAQRLDRLHHETHLRSVRMRYRAVQYP